MMDALQRLVAGATWRDVLVSLADILIVYYTIYRVLLLIKGTRAAQMMIGLVLIGAGFFAAEQLGLATVSWLFDHFINYFIILIIVVFQTDIRRGLVRIGQNLFSFGRTYEETFVFDEILKAVDQLAKARIGALLVFEREAGLSEFFSTGRVIDARISRELLVAVFVPSRDNALHDGAAVIKNLRLQQAGTLLPLSDNQSLDSSLGTRHRAAIGITEETDAVCVVVSEERGEVSLCLGGTIARDMDLPTLRKALMALFYREKGKKQRVVAEEAVAAAAAAQAVAALAAPPRASTQQPVARTSSPQVAVRGATSPLMAAESSPEPIRRERSATAPLVVLSPPTQSAPLGLDAAASLHVLESGGGTAESAPPETSQRDDNEEPRPRSAPPELG
jgi:diadenylate cyclase